MMKQKRLHTKIYLMQKLVLFLQVYPSPIQQQSIWNTHTKSSIQKSQTTQKLQKTNQITQKSVRLQFLINYAIIVLENISLLLIAMIYISGNRLKSVFLLAQLIDSIWIACILSLRALLCLIYILNFRHRWRSLYLIIKIFQLTSLFLFRSSVVIPVILIEIIADGIYVLTKDQISICFDSRFSVKQHFYRLLLIQLMITLLNMSLPEVLTSQQVQGSLLLTIIASLIQFYLVQKDRIYNLILKKVQEYVQGLITIYIAYLLCLYINFPAIQSSTQKITAILLLLPFLAGIFIYLMVSKNYLKSCSKIYLQHRFKQLNNQQKIKYIWEALYFLQASKYIHTDSRKLQRYAEYGQLAIKIKEEFEDNTNEKSNFQADQPSFRQKLQLLKDQFNHHDYRKICRELLERLIYEEGKSSSYFKQLSLFYGRRLMKSYINCKMHEILLEQNNFIFALSQARESLNKKQSYVNNNDGLVGKIVETKRVEFRIQKMAVQYIDYYRKLMSILIQDQIYLKNCFDISQKILNIQNQFLKIGTLAINDKDSQNNCRNKIGQESNSGLQKQQDALLGFEGNYSDSLNNLLSPLSISMLNLLRQYILSEEYLISTQKCSKIQEFGNHERATLIISGQKGQLGRIVQANEVASKLTLYLNQELRGQNFITLLLPKSIQMEHQYILKNEVNLNKNQIQNLPMFIYLIKKTGYSAVCRLSLKNFQKNFKSHWVTTFEEINERGSPIIVCNDIGQVIDLNQNAGLLLGLTPKKKNFSIGKELLQFLCSQKQICISYTSQKKLSEIRKKYCLKLLNSPQDLTTFKKPAYFIIEFKKNPFIQSSSLINVQPQQNLNIPKFEFRFGEIGFSNENVSNEILADQMSNYFATINNTSESQQQQQYLLNSRGIDFAAEINELIYIDNKLQFRENKAFEENYVCSSFPLYIQDEKTSQQMLKGSKYQLPSRTVLRNNVDKYCEKANFTIKSLVFSSVLFLVLIISMLVIGNLVINKTTSILTEESQIHEKIDKILFQYDEILLVAAGNLWKTIGLNLLFENIDNPSDLNSRDAVLHIAEQIQQLLLEIGYSNSLISLNFVDDYNQKIPFYENTVQFEEIQKQFEILLQDFVYKSGNEAELGIKVFQQIIHDINPVYSYQLGQMKKKARGLVIGEVVFFKVSTIVILGVIFIVSILTIFQNRSLNKTRLHLAKLYSGFSQKHLQSFCSRLHGIKSSIIQEQVDIVSILSPNEAQDMIVEEDVKLFHHKKNKQKQQIICNLKLIKYLVIFVTIGLISGSFLLVIFQKATKLQKLGLITQLYLDNIHSKNEIWLHKVLLIYKKTISPQESQQFLQQKIKYLTKTLLSNVRIVQANFYGNYSADGYIPEFMTNYKQKFRDAQFCDSITKWKEQEHQSYEGIQQCKPQFNQYFLSSIESYIEVKSINILRIFDLAYERYQQNNGSIEQSLFASINKGILSTLQNYQQFIFDAVNQQTLLLIKQQNQVIKFYQIVGIIFIGIMLVIYLVWFRLEIQNQKKYIYQSVKMMSQIFPCSILNQNWMFKKWYYQKVIPTVK